MSDLPRLLLCCFDVVPAPTAVSRRLTEYLKGLSDRYQVVVLSVKTPDHAHIERYQGARLLRVPVGSGDLASRAQIFDRAVRRQLESEEYVLTHFFDPYGGYALCERRAELGYKLIYDACRFPSVELPHVVGAEAETGRRQLARVRRQELFCLMNADVVIVANPLTREFIAGLGVAREQIQVIPSPVDLAPFTPEVMGKPDATPMKLVHLGGIHGAHDFDTVLGAMQLALKTADVRLVVVGSRSEAQQQQLEAELQKRSIVGKVELQAQIAHDDVHKVLATADVGLLSLSDVDRNTTVGSPLGRLAEYLAAGRPVIAADVPAARAVVPADAAVWYRPGDVASLADAFVTLAGDPARRVALGAAAQVSAKLHDAATLRADLVALYVGLSGTGARAVGDAEATNPDEVTQLGASLSEDTQRRALAKAAKGDAPSGTAKVKTDPAIPNDETLPAGERGMLRPPVLGTPIRDDDAPVVMGAEFEDVPDVPDVSPTTEPAARRVTEPPVVLGTPVIAPPLEVASPTPRAERSLAEPEARTAAHLSVVPPEVTPKALTPIFEAARAPSSVTAAGATASDGSNPALPPVAVPGPPTETPTSPDVEGKAAQLTPLTSAPQVPAPPVASAPPRSSPSGHAFPVRPAVSPPVLAPASSPPAANPVPSRPVFIPPLSVPPLREVVPAPPPLPKRPLPPPLPANRSSPSGLRSNASGLFPEPPVLLRPGEKMPPAGPPEPEPEAVSDELVEDVISGENIIPGVALPPEEIPVLAAEESIQAVETDPSPPASAIDPWLAQLVHGYCPPASGLFARHTPPTTMPGRDT